MGICLNWNETCTSVGLIGFYYHQQNIPLGSLLQNLSKHGEAYHD